MASIRIICAHISLALIHFFTWEECKTLMALSLGHLLDVTLQLGNLRDDLRAGSLTTNKLGSSSSAFFFSIWGILGHPRGSFNP